MKKLEDVLETLDYLKAGEIITSDGKDQFILRNKKVYRFFDGSTYPMTLEEFVDLYQKNILYLYEEEQVVDEEKDIVYYRDYRK